MSLFRYICASIWLTLLRVLPSSCRVGVRRVGNPDRQSPVLLTGNYRLTVLRVMRALRGVDAWLLVANSRGVNVWCAATGGLLSNHEILSVLKTSGIEHQVDHRKVILPQLAATGIRADVIGSKSGWSVLWGPVEATDLPTYLAGNHRKTAEMRTVGFPWFRRLEMAVAWAFPISLLTLPLFPVWPDSVTLLIGIIWMLASFMFLSFPLYQTLLRRKRQVLGCVLFDFGNHGVLLFLWGLSVLCFFVFLQAGGERIGYSLFEWTILSFVVLLILGLDLRGSTPVYKSALHADRQLQIDLDESVCEGIGACLDVCPRDVFSVDQIARITRFDDCVQCGACIVQCPCDALCFRDPEGGIVAAETIRRFKLNLLGSRKVDTVD